VSPAATRVAVSDPPASGGLGALATTVLLFAAAASRWLAFSPPELPIAAVAWLALVAVAAVRARSLRVLVLAGFAVDLGWWMLVERWIIDVSVAGYPALCLYLALWGAALVWLVRRLSARPPSARWPLWITLPIVVVGLDFLRGEVVFGGYPWYEAGQGLAGWNLVAQSADLLGTRGLTILAAVFAGAIADLARPGSRGVLGLLGAVPVLLATAVGALGYGSWRLAQADSLPPLGRFLAIQTALPIDNKIGWSPERQVEDVPSFARLTLSAVDEVGPPIDLIAWPETMLPGFGLDPAAMDLQESRGLFPGRLFADVVEAVARRAGAPLLVGSPHYAGLRVEVEGARWDWDRHHNSAYLVAPRDGASTLEPPRYDKMVLTPFGETMPGISRFDWLEQALLDIGAKGMSFDLSPGESIVRFEVPSSQGGLIRIATPICFEATVSRLCRALVWSEGDRAADLLVNVSNDGWLGQDDAARRMHLRLASLRAIETRTPMLRAVNTGYSAGIDSGGRIVAGIDGSTTRLGTSAGWVIAELPRDDRRPLFALVGDRWGWLMVAGLVGLIWRTRGTALVPAR